MSTFLHKPMSDQGRIHLLRQELATLSTEVYTRADRMHAVLRDMHRPEDHGLEPDDDAWLAAQRMASSLNVLTRFFADYKQITERQLDERLSTVCGQTTTQKGR